MQNYSNDTGECSQSIGSLIQQSAEALQNECFILQATIEEKNKILQELKETCSRQAKNTAKQQADLEQLKVKTHMEEFKNQAHMSKIQEERNKLQEVEKHFVALQKTINPMLTWIEELNCIFEKLKIKNEKFESYISKCEQEYKFWIEEATKSHSELQKLKDREKEMMADEIKRLRVFLEGLKLQDVETSDFLANKHRDVDAKEVLLRMAGFEVEKERELLIRLQNDIGAETEQSKLRRDELENKLAGCIEEKHKLLVKVEETDQKTNAMSTTMEEIDTKINNLKIEQKRLKSEEENHKNITRNVLLQLEEMESTVKKLEVENNRLINLRTENLALKTKLEDLNSTNENYKTEIAKTDQEEEFYAKEIEKLRSSIKELEEKKESMINERLGINNRILELEKELENDISQHKLLSSQIDKESSDLKNENDRLKSTLVHVNELVLEAIEDKKNTEITLDNLEKELYEARILSEKIYSDLFSFCEKTKELIKFYNEEKGISDDLIEKSAQDYQKTILDGTKNEDMKKLIVKLQADLETKRQYYEKTIQEIQECFQKEMEEKTKKRAEIGVQYETEFRNRELLKTDALVDLKEINARINDTQEQITQAEKENLQILDKLLKYDNLIRKLEGKLNKVAQVAVSSSQSEAAFDSKSQKSILIAKSVTGSQRTLLPASPESDSSGKTFDPEKFKNRRKKLSHKPTQFAKPQSVPKKTFLLPPKPNKNPSPPKKQNNKKVDEDWGWSE